MAKPTTTDKFDPFSRPIPGESLTDAPGSRPWDRPPRFTTPDEVLDMVTDKLEDPEKMDTLMEAIMAGGSIETIVNTIGIEGVTRGEFTPDIAEQVKPPLALFLFDEALKRKIPVQFFDADMENRGKEEQMGRLQMMKNMRPEMFDALQQSVMPPEDEEVPMGIPMMASGGFIKRKGYAMGGGVKDLMDSGQIDAQINSMATEGVVPPRGGPRSKPKFDYSDVTSVKIVDTKTGEVSHEYKTRKNSEGWKTVSKAIDWLNNNNWAADIERGFGTRNTNRYTTEIVRKGKE